MRTFIAVIPPAPVIDVLTAFCAGLRRTVPSLRTEHAEKLHFTLEFLGEKEEAWCASWRDAFTPIASALPHFPVTLNGIGFFPAATQPRIIWAGSRPADNERLCSLASAVRQECTRLGHAADAKQFHPHITLSRVKSQLTPADINRITALAFAPVSFTCTDLVVMKSVLRPQGSVYERLYTIPLQH